MIHTLRSPLNLSRGNSFEFFHTEILMKRSKLIRLSLYYILLLTLIPPTISSLLSVETQTFSKEMGMAGIYSDVVQIWTVNQFNQSIVFHGFNGKSPLPTTVFKFGEKVKSCTLQHEPLIDTVQACCWLDNVPTIADNDYSYSINYNCPVYSYMQKVSTTFMGTFQADMLNLNLIKKFDFDYSFGNNAYFVIDKDTLTLNSITGTNLRDASVKLTGHNVQVNCGSVTGPSTLFDGKPITLIVPSLASRESCSIVVSDPICGDFGPDRSCATLGSTPFYAVPSTLTDIKFINSTTGKLAPGSPLVLTPTATLAGSPFYGPLTVNYICPGYLNMTIPTTFSVPLSLQGPINGPFTGTTCHVDYSWSYHGKSFTFHSKDFIFEASPQAPRLSMPPVKTLSSKVPFFVSLSSLNNVGAPYNGSVKFVMDCSTKTEIDLDSNGVSFVSLESVPSGSCSFWAYIPDYPSLLSEKYTFQITSEITPTLQYPYGKPYEVTLPTSSVSTTKIVNSVTNKPKVIISAPKSNSHNPKPVISDFSMIPIGDLFNGVGPFRYYLNYTVEKVSESASIELLNDIVCNDGKTYSKSFTVYASATDSIFEVMGPFSGSSCKVTLSLSVNSFNFPNLASATFSYSPTELTSPVIRTFVMHGKNYYYTAGGALIDYSLITFENSKDNQLYVTDKGLTSSSSSWVSATGMLFTSSFDDQSFTTQFYFWTPKAGSFSFNLASTKSDEHSLICNGIDILSTPITATKDQLVICNLSSAAGFSLFDPDNNEMTLVPMLDGNAITLTLVGFTAISSDTINLSSVPSLISVAPGTYIHADISKSVVTGTSSNITIPAPAKSTPSPVGAAVMDFAATPMGNYPIILNVYPLPELYDGSDAISAAMYDGTKLLYTRIPIDYSCNDTAKSSGTIEVVTNEISISPFTTTSNDVYCTYTLGEALIKSSFGTEKPPSVTAIVPTSIATIPESVLLVIKDSSAMSSLSKSLSMLPTIYGHYSNSKKSVPLDLADTITVSCSYDDGKVHSKFTNHIANSVNTSILPLTISSNTTLSCVSSFIYQGKNISTTLSYPLYYYAMPSTSTAPVPPPPSHFVVPASVKDEAVPDLLFGCLPRWFIAIIVFGCLGVIIGVAACFTKCFHVKDRIRKRRMNRAMLNESDPMTDPDQMIELEI